ncbi:MAG: hypothetical protein ACM337_08975 [Syntrophaceae bacterium]
MVTLSQRGNSLIVVGGVVEHGLGTASIPDSFLEYSFIQTRSIGV